MQIIDGNKIAKQIEEKLKKAKDKGGLSAILVGNNPESHLYVKLKEHASKRVGIYFKKYFYPENVTEEEIIKKIKELNKDKKITGILIQLPLPQHLDTDKIIASIDPEKDVDGFHPHTKKISPVLCATLEALKATGINLKEKKVLMITKSCIFPIPFITELAPRVTYFKTCRPKDAEKYIKDVDVVITAVGSPHYLKADMIKSGTVVIDIGIHKDGKKVYGDADIKSLAKKVSWITPVPGGIGPLTVACLLKNIIK